MSKHKKVHQIGNPGDAQNKHHAEMNASELHELKHPGQSADPRLRNDSILAIAGWELKENLAKCEYCVETAGRAAAARS